MVTVRDYQLEATSLEQHWISGGTAALIDMATATGKSWVLAETMRRTIAADPHARLLLAVHVRELVEQDVDAILSIWPEAPYGICSEGVGRRDHDQQIILGTIQTLFRDAHLLGRRDLLLIDEVQLVPREGEAMYLTLIDTLRPRTPELRMVGASATCFRLHIPGELERSPICRRGRGRGRRDCRAGRGPAFSRRARATAPASGGTPWAGLFRSVPRCARHGGTSSKRAPWPHDRIARFATRTPRLCRLPPARGLARLPAAQADRAPVDLAL